MTDDRMDALLRRLDTTAHPDAAFVNRTLAVLLPTVRRARRRDASWLGRLRRAMSGRRVVALRPVVIVPRPLVYLAVLAALLLVALGVTLLAVGALNRPTLLGNGPIVIAVKGQVQLLDPVSGETRTVTSGESTKGLSRSPDGRWISFWELREGGQDRLVVLTMDDTRRREIEIETPLSWGGCIDVWSAQSDQIVSSVTVDGRSRLLIADVEAGTGRLVTPPGIGARCGLWSPHGDEVAFALKEGGRPAGLAVMRVDGSAPRLIEGLERLDVSGANSWSSDGRWIYFDASANDVSQVFRADVIRGVAEPLTDPALSAAAPALSPDDRLLTFLVPVSRSWTDAAIHAANADGTDRRLVLDHAGSYGWSTDSQHILAEWKPPDRVPGALVTIRPDGTDRRVILDLDPTCSAAIVTPCLDGLGWGQPRP